MLTSQGDVERSGNKTNDRWTNYKPRIKITNDVIGLS